MEEAEQEIELQTKQEKPQVNLESHIASDDLPGIPKRGSTNYLAQDEQPSDAHPVTEELKDLKLSVEEQSEVVQEEQQ